MPELEQPQLKRGTRVEIWSMDHDGTFYNTGMIGVVLGYSYLPTQRIMYKVRYGRYGFNVTWYFANELKPVQD